MHVILGDMPLDDFYRFGKTNFPEHITSLESYVSRQYGFTILRYPHQMQVDAKNTMAAMTIFVHGLDFKQEMLKLPAKAGGFNPPKVGQ